MPTCEEKKLGAVVNLGVVVVNLGAAVVNLLAN